jgi:dTDP-glucose 4,6-dehydratase
MNTILIAGGAGFVGSHLCALFLERGDTVTCVDNVSTGRRQNIAPLLDNNRFTFVQADICEPSPAAVADTPYDVVVNMASPASPPHYQRLAVETLRVGSLGTQNLLELARRHKARFLQASTSEVYGDPSVHPQPESYYGNVNSYGPRAMYDEAKRYGEALVYVYRHQFEVNTAIVRIFNTYGPHMDPKDGRVVSNFITQALAGEPITIYGDGSQTRSFCYVDDLVAGIAALIDSDEPGPMNIGNPSEYTVAELAELIVRKTGSKSEIVHQPLPGDDPTQRRPDISYARKALNWEPKVSVDDGLQRTIEYFAGSMKK